MEANQAKKKSPNRYAYLLLLLFVAGAGVVWMLRKGDQPPSNLETTPTTVVEQRAPEAEPSIAPVTPEPEMAAAPEPAPAPTPEPAPAPAVKKRKVRPKEVAVREQPVAPAQETEIQQEPQAEQPAPPPEEPQETARAEEPLPEIDRDAAGLTVVFKDELRWFKPTEVELVVDGQPLVAGKSLTGIDARGGVPIYVGDLPPGEHSFALRVKLAGDSKMFPYLKDYKFTAQKGGTIKLQPRETRLMIKAKAGGNVTDEWQDRISLEVGLEPTGAPAA